MSASTTRPESRNTRRAFRSSRALRADRVTTPLLSTTSTDASIALGGAFTSVMTGNLVILGASASTADGALAIASGGAIVAFYLGAWAGAAGRRRAAR